MEEKTAVETLVKQIKTKGYKYIENMLDDKHGENLYIDFKQAQNKDYSIRKTLCQNDWKNLARAISGFGNSEGGLIIWGVEAKKEKDGSNDYIKNIVEIVNPENFRSLVDSSVSLCTSPFHNQVESYVLKKKASATSGLVITVIPKSNNRPIQNIFEKDNRYYLRVGDSFESITDSFIRSLIGNNPLPDVGINYHTAPPSIVAPIAPEVTPTIKIVIGIAGVNFGVGIAKDIFGHARCWIKGGSEIGINLSDTTNYSYQRAFGVEYSFMSKDGYKLGFQQRSQMMVLTFFLKPPFESDLTIDLLISSNGQFPSKKTIKHTPIQLQELYDKLLANQDNETVRNFLGAEIVQEETLAD